MLDDLNANLTLQSVIAMEDGYVRFKASEMKEGDLVLVSTSDGDDQSVSEQPAIIVKVDYTTDNISLRYFILEDSTYSMEADINDCPVECLTAHLSATKDDTIRTLLSTITDTDFDEASDDDEDAEYIDDSSDDSSDEEHEDEDDLTESDQDDPEDDEFDEDELMPMNDEDDPEDSGSDDDDEHSEATED